MRLCEDHGMASKGDKINGKSLPMADPPQAISAAASHTGPKTTATAEFDFHGRNGDDPLIGFRLRRGLPCGA